MEQNKFQLIRFNTVKKILLMLADYTLYIHHHVTSVFNENIE